MTDKERLNKAGDALSAIVAVADDDIAEPDPGARLLKIVQVAAQTLVDISPDHDPKGNL